MSAPAPCTARMRTAAAAMLALLAGCALRSGGDGRVPRADNVTLHILSQSCFQGEIVPCG